MNWVVLFDVVATAAFLCALLLVPRIPTRVLDRQSRLLLLVCIALLTFHSSSNVLQHGDITSHLDPFEDYAEVLFVPTFLFFLLSAMAGSEHRQRLRTERSLRESETRFRELAELLPEIVFESDLAGRLTFVNRRGLEATGYVEEDLAGGFRVRTLLGLEDRARARANATAVFAGGETRGVEYTIHRKDGTTFPCLAFVAPIFRGGRPCGMRGIIVDASRSKELEAQLLQAQKMEAVGTLAGGVAHDFNNIIHAISGYLQLVLNSDRVAPEDRRRLQRAEQGCARAAELVRGLLTFSRRSEPSLTTVDLNREVAQVLSILEHTLPKMIRIVPNLGTGLWPVKGDPVQMEQVLLNLASNARDAIRGQGTLTIATANVELGPGDVRRTDDLPPGRYARLTVSDDGEGMAPEVVEQVFDPFFTTKAVGRGTGLGLAVVYGIVHSHGGRVSCHSVSGRGSTFTIHLPADFPSNSESPTPLSPPVPSGVGQLILVVDDEENVREIAREGLAGAGYRVLAAASGEEALELLASPEAPDLVVLDLGMPGMGGRRCLEEIRARQPDLPVLVASGYSLEDEEGLDADGSLGKPYRISTLLSEIHRLLAA